MNILDSKLKENILLTENSDILLCKEGNGYPEILIASRNANHGIYQIKI